MIDLKGNPFHLSDDGVRWVIQTLADMTLEEKIGQLFVPIGLSGDPNFLERMVNHYHVGGMMYRSADSTEIQATFRYLQTHSQIPLLIAANLEDGGIGIASDGTFFGKQMQIAATGKPENAYRLGKISCAEGHAVGCNWAFAPIVDIDRNWRNPITNVRTYGSDPEMVLACAKEYLRAAKEENVAVSIKHFPGDGCDEVDQHILTSVNDLSCEEWDDTYGHVYQELIEAGAQTVMVGHIAMPAYQKKYKPQSANQIIPATLSPELLKNLLREKLGFNGLIVSDATSMVGFNCAMERSRSVPYSIEAGCDMFLFNKDLDEDYRFMMEGYQSGILSHTRLEEAVTRILATKAALGLHCTPCDAIVPPQGKLNIMQCEQHVSWAVNAADEAVTLVKDTQNLLPISSAKYPKVLLEIMGDCPSNERVISRFEQLLKNEGFKVERYVQEEFFTMAFDVRTFRDKYDLVIYLGNVENESNRVTNRLNWFTLWGHGNNVPWFVKERPAMFISLANPYHLVDVPMIKTYINCYSNSDYILDAVMDKIMGRSPFLGKSPIDPFCGKEHLKW